MYANEKRKQPKWLLTLSLGGWIVCGLCRRIAWLRSSWPSIMCPLANDAFNLSFLPRPHKVMHLQGAMALYKKFADFPSTTLSKTFIRKYRSSPRNNNAA